jgi:hypothetical protein
MLNFGGSATAGIQDATGLHGNELAPPTVAVIYPGRIIRYVQTDPTHYTQTTDFNLISKWEDISQTGTLAATASNCDDCGQDVTMPFVFSFFGSNIGPGQPQTAISVGSNGTVTMASGFGSPFMNLMLPATGAPHSLITCLWDDLNTTDTVSPGSNIVYQTLGTAPNREFVIQYVNVPLLDLPSDKINTQLVLYETTNRIECRYGPSVGPDDLVIGSSATAGINSPNGLNGFSASYNAATLNQGTTIDFIPNSNTDTTVYTQYGPNPGLPDISRAVGAMSAPTAAMDDMAQDVPIGFPLAFYGTTYTSVSLNDNGGIAFGTGAYIPHDAFDLPTPIPYDGPKIVADMGDVDTAVNPTHAVYYLTTGPVGDRIFTAQWQSQNSSTGSATTGFDITYTIQILEVDGSVRITYGGMVGRTADATAVGTVGIENGGLSAVEVGNSNTGLTMSGQTFWFSPF